MYNKLSIIKLHNFVFQKCIYNILNHHFIQSPKQFSQTLQVIAKVAQLCPTLRPELAWVAFPFSWGSSQLRGQTQAFHIVGRFFNIWATKKAQL